MATSKYTTPDSSQPGDMICQICLGPLRACLALKPCGHNFCAACLSHHFASLLQVLPRFLYDSLQSLLQPCLRGLFIHRKRLIRCYMAILFLDNLVARAEERECCRVAKLSAAP